MGFVLAILACIALAIGGNLACAQIPGEGRAEQAARNLGMEQPRVVARKPAWGVLGGCHEQDVTKFTVRGIDGRQIEVCAPIIGGYTVRS